MKRLNKFSLISFILTVILLLSVNSFAQDFAFSGYTCIEQTKDGNGNLKSSISGSFTLTNNGLFFFRKSETETITGNFTKDDAGIINLKGNDSSKDFYEAVAYPSKIKPNRYHFKLDKNKPLRTFTCDLQQDQKMQVITDTPLYALLTEKKPLSNSEETEIANEFALVVQNSANQSKNETTVGAKTDDVAIKTNPTFSKKAYEKMQNKIANDPKARQTAEEYLTQTSENKGIKDFPLTYNPENVAVQYDCKDFAIIRNSKTESPTMRLGISKDGKVLVPPVFEDVSYDPCKSSYWQLGRYYPVKLNGLWGYWDIEKQVMFTDFIYWKVTPFSQGIALVTMPTSQKSFIGMGTKAELDSKVKEINEAIEKLGEDFNIVRNSVENETNNIFLPQWNRANNAGDRAEAVKALRNFRQFQSRQYDYYFNTLLPNLRQSHGATAQVAAEVFINALDVYFKKVFEGTKQFADKAGIKLSEYSTYP